MGHVRPSLRAAVVALVVGVVLALTGCGSSTSGGSASSSTRPSSTTRLAATTSTRPTSSTRPAATTSTRASSTTQRGTTGLATVTTSALPPEARATLALIDRGGPFRHSQDGQVFQNREGVLPRKSSGYYHEYTVETPGSADRGARRIVTGSGGEQFYTDDHYVSFREIVDG